MQTKIVNIMLRLLSALRPPPMLTLSQWSPLYRVISSEESSSPGKWCNERVPYCVEVMDAISDPKVRQVVFMSGTQQGKTSMLLNALAYHIHLDPCPIMVVEPTVEMAETFSTKRLTPMIRDTTVLHDKISPEKSRSTDNTIKEKSFSGGYIVMSGANSAPSLKSRPIRLLLFDELDEAPDDLAGQGSPIKLAVARTDSFPNRKIVLTSTPTVKGHSKIENAYNNSTQERWSHCCPSCKEWSQYSWRRLDFETEKMACPHCGVLHSRREWGTAGKWIADNPGHEIRGFHVNALDSNTLTWRQLIDDWVEAQHLAKKGDFTVLKTFINTKLSETWEERGESVENHALQDRCEVYPAELPDGVCIITAGIDIQHNRIAVGVWGWTIGFENYLLLYKETWGDPREGAIWNQVDELMSRSWSYANGKKLRISRAAVDTGDGNLTPIIYSYCQARQSKIYAIKGQGGDKLPLTRPSKKAREKGLFMVGVDGIKADIYSWLKIGKMGNGLCHFPKGADGQPVNGCDADFFEMLTVEKRVFRQDKKGFGKYEWIKPKGARNEALDVFVYARAALRIMSSQDAQMLMRIYLSAPWEQPENVPVKPPPKQGKNAKARELGIQL